jgi:hypothetical protein
MPKRKIRFNKESFTPKSFSRLAIADRKRSALDTFTKHKWVPLGNSCFMNTGYIAAVQIAAGHICNYDGYARALYLEEDSTLGCVYCSIKVGKRKAAIIILQANMEGGFLLESIIPHIKIEEAV